MCVTDRRVWRLTPRIEDEQHGSAAQQLRVVTDSASGVLSVGPVAFGTGAGARGGCSVLFPWGEIANSTAAALAPYGLWVLQSLPAGQGVVECDGARTPWPVAS